MEESIKLLSIRITKAQQTISRLLAWKLRKSTSIQIKECFIFDTDLALNWLIEVSWSNRFIDRADIPSFERILHKVVQ